MDKADYRRHLEEADKQYVWHPFTQMQDWIKETPVIIEAGEDCFLVDVNGKRYIDGVSSLWVNIFGHRKKDIDYAITAQLGKIAHSTMLGLSSVPAIELAERLSGLVNRSILGEEERSGSLGQMTKTELNPAGLSRIFYSDNGSTAVEVAIKMAFQYWKHKGVSGRHSFLSLKNAYHGDTLGAVSVGGVDLFHNVFGPLLFRTFRAPSPYCYRCELGKNCADCGLACIGSMEDILREHHDVIAAVILEPLVQAAGGMIVAPPGYLSGVRTLCDKYDVLLIADEVATGFGRTGEMFACAHEDVLPDIICLSKGITGGYLPLAATLSTEKIYAAFLGDFNELKTFFHGHSYTGNPLACAAGLACLEIFEREKTLEDLVPKIRMLERWLEEVSVLPLVGNVRNMGFMAGVELVRDKHSKEPFAWEEKMGWKVACAALDMGVFIRPLGNVIVIMPPLAISSETLGQMLTVLKAAIVSSAS
jgi:adenosylmethionine---8-amino-7-oxononanoate aminotransferase